MDFYMQFSLTIASGARMDLQNRREGKKKWVLDGTSEAAA